jgi:hypothetical protein
MSQYYFVAAALPVLSIETRPEISALELKELFALNLSQKDLQKVDALLTLIDLSNLRSFWRESEIDKRGTFTEKELEEALLVKEGLPSFVLDYLDRYESTMDRLRYFPSLYVSLYGEMEEKMTGFLKRYYSFEREVRLILTALRAKRYGRDIVRELQFEDPTDSLVASILAQKDSSEYTPPAEYTQLLNLLIGNPNEQQKALIAYELQMIEEMEGEEPFSIDHLLGYMARLIRIESWYTSNREAGLSLIEELSKYG